MDWLNLYRKEISLALILILILIIIVNVYTNNKIFTDFIEGLWTTSESFASQAGIDGMMVYIGSNDSSKFISQERKAYLIMYSHDQIIANKKFNIIFKNPLTDFLNPFSKQKIIKNIKLKEIDSNNSDDNDETESLVEEIDD